ncbi:MAG TPA: nuclear transport factor 2 family protein [Steroidobacteraceae bacterium]|jgi:ketosteroid isomerase-like protein
MRNFTVSRRILLGTGLCVLAGEAAFPPIAAARGWAGLSAANQRVIREYYAGWEKKDWGSVDALLTDNFTFSSAAPDDHISKGTLKTQCWDTQSALIKAFDLERVFGSGDEAFVKYLCQTKNGKSFRNVEYLRLRDKKVESIECYFGGPGFPSAANTGHT